MEKCKHESSSLERIKELDYNCEDTIKILIEDICNDCVFDKINYEDENELSNFSRILQNNISELKEDEIKSSGYVVHTLEASLWCLLTSNSYKETILKAVNLGIWLKSEFLQIFLGFSSIFPIHALTRIISLAIIRPILTWYSTASRRCRA